MNPTADQVIKEYEALPPEEKQKVYITLTQRGNEVPLMEEKDLVDELKSIENLSARPVVFYKPGADPIQLSSQKILWKNMLIGFVPNKYVSDYSEIWLLEAVLGSATVRERLDESHILDVDFIEDLFQQVPYSFYLNQAETWLFSDYADLNEVEGGPLKQLTAFDALQRYGLKLLEEAKEKQYIRL